MFNIQQIKAGNPIDSYLRKAGIIVSDKENKPTCCCPFHNDTNPSMSIRLDKQDWRCWTCGIGGSVIDLHMRLKGLSAKDAIRELAEIAGVHDDHHGKAHLADTYEYRDESGKLIMCVDRIEEGQKKKFAQYTKNESGERVNSVTNIKKVLYRLENWCNKPEVALCEGEKCVKALESLGMDATTNAGGSSAWIDAYAYYLAGKHVDIWPDNDAPGGKWLESVTSSLKGKVASLRVLVVPKPYNDIADVVLTQGEDIARETIMKLQMDTRRITKGVSVPILSASDMYDLYVKRVMASKDGAGIDLSRWLPSLRDSIRPLMAGDLAVILADTGAGKTTMLANIAYSQSPLPVLLFELELQPEDMCERFLAMDANRAGKHISSDIEQGKGFNVSRWGNIYVCPNSKVSVEDMEGIINTSELYIGKRPCLVLVDYIGLMSGGQGKRYERMSTIAEGLKVMAKATNTVVLLSSQIHRDKERKGINLHDAKDSGSIESSAQLVIGAVRTDKDRIDLTILKCTKSLAGKVINCTFNGDTQRIREISR